VSAEISTAGVRPKPVLDLSKWDSVSGSKRHRPLIRKAEKQIADGNDELGELELLVRQLKEAILLENKKEAESAREELIDLLEDLV